MAGWRAQRRRQAWGRGAFLGACVFGLAAPIAWTMLASFEIKPESGSSPPGWTGPLTADSYVEVMTRIPHFPQVVGTSLLLATSATVLTIGAAFLGAYSLARWRFHGRRVVVQAFLVLASLPVVAYVIPMSGLAREVHLHDTFFGVTLAAAAVYAPLAVYVLFGYLAQVPRTLEEVARLEGAGMLRVICQIVAPAVGPGLAATAVLVFVLDWNLFLVPTALTLNHVKTIPMALSDFYTYERELEWSNAAAAITLSLVPAAALAAFAHRLLEQFSLSPTSEDA
jgi:ABC-type glycerol-3-phosphate transport system permease component